MQKLVSSGLMSKGKRMTRGQQRYLTYDKTEGFICSHTNEQFKIWRSDLIFSDMHRVRVMVNGRVLYNGLYLYSTFLVLMTSQSTL